MKPEKELEKHGCVLSSSQADTILREQNKQTKEKLFEYIRTRGMHIHGFSCKKGIQTEKSICNR
jgi:hypothetical protein